jgi:phospholipase/carboxylesterase
MSLLSFVHTFVPGENSAKRPILLLHRTGASESALIPWAQKLWPGVALLAPRGRILEDGKPRFFRRLGQAQFDAEDLRVQTAALDAFITAARQHYSLDAPIAIGHSNGANIGWSLIFARPHALSAAILLRPLMPINPGEVGTMQNFPVLILSGKNDRIAPPPAAALLPDRLKSAGADVSHVFLNARHDLVQEDGDIARAWLRSYFTPTDCV